MLYFLLRPLRVSERCANASAVAPPRYARTSCSQLGAQLPVVSRRKHVSKKTFFAAPGRLLFYPSLTCAIPLRRLRGLCRSCAGVIPRRDDIPLHRLRGLRRGNVLAFGEGKDKRDVNLLFTNLRVLSIPILKRRASSLGFGLRAQAQIIGVAVAVERVPAKRVPAVGRHAFRGRVRARLALQALAGTGVGRGFRALISRGQTIADQIDNALRLLRGAVAIVNNLRLQVFPHFFPHFQQFDL